MSPSAYLRGAGNAIFYTLHYLAHLRRHGVRVINGYDAYVTETSKALQLSLLQDLGLPFPLARVIWVAVSQAQASEMTRRGDPERSTGPLVRFPAPVIVVLSSPNVVSDALHRVRYASRTASAGAA